MSEPASSLALQQLDQRHDELIRDLSELNGRLEQALRSFSNSAERTDTHESESIEESHE